MTSNPILRLDTDHHVALLMQNAVDCVFGGQLTVQLVRDRVQLSGRVTSWHQKQLAQESVRRLAAGRHISNNICVDAGEQRSIEI